MSKNSQKVKEDRDEAVKRLEKQVVHAKRLAVEKFKSSDDFQEIVWIYGIQLFWQGLWLLQKRQISRLHPDLDIQEMKIDS